MSSLKDRLQTFDKVRVIRIGFGEAPCHTIPNKKMKDTIGMEGTVTRIQEDDLYPVTVWLDKEKGIWELYDFEELEIIELGDD